MLINQGETVDLSGVPVELIDPQWNNIRLSVDGHTISTSLGEDIQIGDQTWHVLMLTSPAVYADGSKGDNHSFSLALQEQKN